MSSTIETIFATSRKINDGIHAATMATTDAIFAASKGAQRGVNAAAATVADAVLAARRMSHKDAQTVGRLAGLAAYGGYLAWILRRGWTTPNRAIAAMAVCGSLALLQQHLEA